jgi:hypothetical protein
MEYGFRRYFKGVFFIYDVFRGANIYLKILEIKLPLDF